MFRLIPVVIVISSLLSIPHLAGPPDRPKSFCLGEDWAVDSRRNVYAVAGNRSPGKYTVVKFDKHGAIQWEHADIPFFDRHSVFATVAIDNSDCVYTTCLIPIQVKVGEVAEQISGAMTVKYDKAGELLWSTVANAWAGNAVFPSEMAIDPLGGVYVTGTCGEPSYDFPLEDVRKPPHTNGSDEEQRLWRFQSSSQPPDYDIDLDIALIKYDSQGRQLWMQRWAGHSRQTDSPVALAADDNGDIYVAGTTETAAPNCEVVILKYDRSGRPLWERRYSKAKGTINSAVALALGPGRTVHVVAWTMTLNPRQTHLVILKYTSNGKQSWVRYYKDSEGKEVGPDAIVIDDDGNSYVLGYASISPWDAEAGKPPPKVKAEFVIIKYDPEGTRLWVAKYERPKQPDAWLYDLRVDTNRNVYAIGATADKGLIVKYDPSGKQQSVIRPKNVPELVEFFSGLPF